MAVRVVVGKPALPVQRAPTVTLGVPAHRVELGARAGPADRVGLGEWVAGLR